MFICKNMLTLQTESGIIWQPVVYIWRNWLWINMIIPKYEKYL